MRAERQIFRLYDNAGLPLSIHLLGFFGAMDSGYDMARLELHVELLCFAYAVKKQKIFDVVGVAHEGILSNMEMQLLL